MGYGHTSVNHARCTMSLHHSCNKPSWLFALAIHSFVGISVYHFTHSQYSPIEYPHMVMKITSFIAVLLGSPIVMGTSEAPFRSLLDTTTTTSSIPLPTSSRRRFSRARVETLSEEMFFPISQLQEEGWIPHDLSVRSQEFGNARSSNDQGTTGTTQGSAFPPSSVPGNNELQLHLEELPPQAMAKSTLVATRRLDPFSPAGTTTINNNDSNNYKEYYKKTGTTIAGCICQDGHVILAADTRATQNTIVADKNAQKLHPLAQNAWCAGAGTSADLEMITRLCLYSMALEQLRTHTIGNDNNSYDKKSYDKMGSGGGHLLAMYATSLKEEDGNSLLVGKVSVGQICSFLQEKIWKGQGNLGVNLILGCVDRGKAYLRALHPHGSMDVDLPFAALGSGGLAAMSILERGYRRDLNLTEATKLVQAAIVAGIQNDLGSGSQVDLCIIAPDGSSQMTRCVVPSQTLDVLEAPNMGTRLSVEDSAGINGFGNSPFRIKSRRILVNTKHENEWTTFLGLPNGA